MTSVNPRLPRVGELLGERYRIERALARGGMGVVYEALDEGLGRRVAVKVLPPFARADQAHTRFLRECRLTASVHHPNVIPIYDAGFHEERVPYLVMERLEGTTLGKQVKAHGPLSVSGSLRVTVGVCAALEAAHAREVLHRDVKPANVFLTAPPGERVVLFDFGLSLDVSRRTRITDQGVVVGTPAYMAPEQVLGRFVDARADVFGAGTVAYRALTGQRHVPDGLREITEVFDAIVHQPIIPLRQHNPRVPEHVEAVVLRALAKAPEQRFQSAQALRVALEEALAEHVARHGSSAQGS
jgi:serine/threonine protein kinase